MARLDDERIGAGQPEPAQRDDRGARREAERLGDRVGGRLRAQAEDRVPGCSPWRSISRLNE